MKLELPDRIQAAVAMLCTSLTGRGRVLLFGSRARGAARENSDYDIGILSGRTLDWTEYAWLKTQAEDLGWPYHLDVVDLARAPDDFRRAVLESAVELSLDGNDIITLP